MLRVLLAALYTKPHTECCFLMMMPKVKNNRQTLPLLFLPLPFSKDIYLTAIEGIVENFQLIDCAY